MMPYGAKNPTANYAAHHAKRDPADGRDRPFVPRPGVVPPSVPLSVYQEFAGPVFDQGHERCCTGAALSAMANYLIRRAGWPDHLEPVSARMLYEMARRYDGNNDPAHEGSTARAAVKGWAKDGVCSNDIWPFKPFDTDRTLNPARVKDAKLRPLGAYHRVDHARIEQVRAAIAERGAVYVTAEVHEGWHQVGADGLIPYPRERIGAHAFVLCAYDDDGIWLHNSKGSGWGVGGYAKLSNRDWLNHAQDAWVVSLADRPPAR